MTAAAAPLLAVEGLAVGYATRQGLVRAADNIGFTLEAGETLGIVGESGSGKSQTLFSILGLLPRNAQIGGSIRFEGKDLLKLGEAELAAVRGSRISLVFQDPLTALNPYLTVGRQLTEVLTHHRGLPRKEARAAALRALEKVRIPQAELQLRRYPHQLSGGMRQRVVIAMALIAGPALVLADEPTTALDVTIQAEILDLLAELGRSGTAIIVVTHDLGVIARIADRVLVMYAGRIVEEGSTFEVFRSPRHPYTRALLASVPRLDDDLSLGGHPPIEGQPPDLLHLPQGCAFEPRCGEAMPICRRVAPLLREIAAGTRVACHLGDPEVAKT